ncbi:hypothetical protein BD289DRAFT_251853 [Coniella lustricola]|uniref:Uncharacterized protein n=1 Tax=Coniella lustricola TaxID=2025994 RepID=A0A2T3A8L9_9PEZI|nr:hypothetical protein BD289DRAFT_251853 [Coniella lustricola]
MIEIGECKQPNHGPTIRTVQAVQAGSNPIINVSNPLLRLLQAGSSNATPMPRHRAGRVSSTHSAASEACTCNSI